MRYFLGAILVLLIVAYLAGCSVIERHPVATGIVTSVLVTSIALSTHHHNHERATDVSAPLVTCQPVSSCQ